MKTFKKTAIATALVAVSLSANATHQNISVDKFHTLFIDQETKEAIVIGGSEFFNEMGDYAKVKQDVPVPYGVGNAVSVQATAFRSYVLKYDGTLWASGREFGRTPVKLPFENVKDMAGTSETVLVLVGTEVYEYVIKTGISTKVDSLPNNIVEVSADYYHCVVRTSDGDVYRWGHNNTGQLGDGTLTQMSYPVLLEDIPVIEHISTSQGNTVLTDTSGGVWIFGEGRYGRTGNGTDENQLVPLKLLIDNPEDVKKGYAGYKETLILYKDGSVKTIGWHNFIGQSTDNTQLYNRNYQLVGIPELYNVDELDATGDHKLFINKDKTIIGWGSGGNGQLGNGKFVETHYPEYVMPTQYPDNYVIEYQEPVVSLESCPAPSVQYVEKEVIKEVPVIQYVEKEVIKEVPVIQYIEKEVIKEVPVIQYVEKEVIKKVPVIQYVEKEVIKKVPTKSHDDNGHGNDKNKYDESNPGKKYKKYKK